MEFDPFAPYGRLVETTVRVLSWNTWGLFADDAARARLDAIAAECRADILCLPEAWSTGDDNQARHLQDVLELADSHWSAGIGIVSRWPITEREDRPLLCAGAPKGTASLVRVDGPRGVLDVFAAMLDYPLGASRGRQEQVGQLLQFVEERTSGRHTTILCGDFNAAPDSDEIRLITGRAAHASGDLVCYDAWETAGDGSPGYTFARENPAAAISLYPDRRFDYVFSAWPRAGGRGHPVACEIVGRHRPGQPAPSDHYGVVADLRY